MIELIYRTVKPKVIDYRDSGEYDRSGYGPFIEQNADLLRAVEEAMGLQENDREIQRDARQEFDQEQIDRSKQLIEGWLADIPTPEWHHVEEYVDWYGNYGGNYDIRYRRLQLRAVDGSSLPSLSVTEEQSNNKPEGLDRRRQGLITRYNITLDDGDENLMRYAFKGDFTPEHSPYPDPSDKNQQVSEQALAIADQQALGAIQDQVAQFPNFALYSLLTQAKCNEVLAQYREFEDQGHVTKVAVDRQK